MFSLFYRCTWVVSVLAVAPPCPLPWTSLLISKFPSIQSCHKTLLSNKNYFLPEKYWFRGRSFGGIPELTLLAVTSWSLSCCPTTWSPLKGRRVARAGRSFSKHLQIISHRFVKGYLYIGISLTECEHFQIHSFFIKSKIYKNLHKIKKSTYPDIVVFSPWSTTRSNPF